MKHRKIIAETIEANQHLIIKLLLECWNHKTPHFGGAGPHRYDGKERECAYCNRPINWKPVNAGFAASEIAEFIEKKKGE